MDRARERRVRRVDVKMYKIRRHQFLAVTMPKFALSFVASFAFRSDAHKGVSRLRSLRLLG
jgi:hypothetical protein